MDMGKGVEVFVEVVETLQIKGFTENGMQDARRTGGFFRWFCVVKNVKNNYCPREHQAGRRIRRVYRNRYNISCQYVKIKTASWNIKEIQR